MNRKNNWLWGLFFLIAAGAVLFNQMFSFLHISLFQVLFTILMLCIIVKHIPYRNFFGILIPAAFIYKTYSDSFFRLVPFSGWSVIWASVFASIGLSFMFRRRPYGHFQPDGPGPGSGPEGDHGGFYEKAENMDGNTVYGKVTLGSDTKYIHSRSLEYGQFICTMGGLKIYLDQALPAPGGAEIVIDSTMSGVELYVPHDWYVEDDIHAVIGGVNFKGRSTAIPGQSPRLILKGSVQLGGLEIIYV